MARGVNIAPEVALNSGDLRTRFDAIKEFSPALARRTRAVFRRSGDEIITEQRAILDGPLPPGIAVIKQRKVLVYSKKSSRYTMRKINVFGDVAVKNPGRSRGLREGIKAGLKTRVVFAKKTSIRVQTTNARKTGSNFWQAQRFRHKTYGRLPWVYQRGQPFFWGPAFRGAGRMVKRVDGAIDEAMKQISDKK